MNNNAQHESTPSNPQLNRFQIWLQLGGLVLLLVSVMFSWMIYGVFQPKILNSLGFTTLASQLGIYQGFLGAIVEPLIGWKSDQIFRRLHTRLPMIMFGVTMAALICVIVAVLWQQQIIMTIRGVVPIIMTVWVMTMIVFRGPAIALLRQFTPSELPQANALLTLLFAIMGAVSPLVESLLKQWGVTITFLLGGIGLSVGALVFRLSQPVLILPPVLKNERSISIKKATLIFAVGLAVGVQTTLLFKFCPQILHQQVQSIEPAYLSSMILIVSAISILPLKRLTATWGIGRSMFGSLVSIALLLGALNAPFVWMFVVLFGVAFGVLFISQIPFVLRTVPSHQAGLGTGLYFGGIGGGSAVLSLLLQQPSSRGIFACALFATAIGLIGLVGAARRVEQPL